MDIFEFAEIDEFLKYFKPLSQYAKINFNKRKIFVNIDILQNEYNLINTLIDFIKYSQSQVSLIENSLKKISIINISDNYSFTDIYLVKKFLANFQKIYLALPNDIKEKFGFFFVSDELLYYLSLGNENSDNFYISSNYDNELKSLRAKIAGVDEKIKNLKNDIINKILKDFNLDFRYSDFLVVNNNIAKKLDKNIFFFEPFDGDNIIVKINYPEDYFNLLDNREIFSTQEQNIVNKIINEISSRIYEHNEHLKKYISIITKFDIILAKARLAIDFNLNKPNVNTHSSITIKNGIFYPLKEKCIKKNIKYTPLTANFDYRINIINGSNMGGKTIFLKTLSFLQLLAQMGFYVPAEKFETIIFNSFGYIGDISESNIEGLSSFGLEINNFNQIEKNFHHINLLIMDEFARTTNSIEAKALLNAIVEYLSQNKNCYVFISTHFMDLNKLPNIKFYKMKGLNYQEFKKVYIDKDLSLDQRITLINSFMTYEIEENTKYKPIYDALNIAKILGLNQQILELAKNNIERSYE